MAATARAIITRCNCPPESWCGKLFKRSSGLGIPTSFNNSIDLLLHCSLDNAGLFRKRVSEKVFPILYKGSKDLPGSWKIILILLPRIFDNSLRDNDKTEVPSIKISPLLTTRLGKSPIIDVAVTLLPEPDSPTIPRISPGNT